MLVACHSRSGGVLNRLADLWAVVFPDIAGTVGVLQELFLGRPVVAHGDVAAAFIGIEVKPVVGIVDV